MFPSPIHFTVSKFEFWVYSCNVAALGPGSLFGIATFSHKIGLYDVQGPIPVVKNVFIHPDSLENLAVELEDVMPLLSFLAPVCLLMKFCMLLYFCVSFY